MCALNLDREVDTMKFMDHDLFYLPTLIAKLENEEGRKRVVVFDLLSRVYEESRVDAF